MASLSQRRGIRGQNPNLLSLEYWNLPVRGAEVFSLPGSGRDCGRWWKTLGVIGHCIHLSHPPPPALLSLPFLLLSSPGVPDGSHCTHALALLQVKRPSDALWFPWQRALEPRGISICRARAGERSKRHRLGLRHLFKTIPLFPIRGGQDDAPLFQKWDLEMK